VPTEDEWEYACRAGNPGRFCFGDLTDYARFFARCNGQTVDHHRVAQYMPNTFGLFDMHGGLWELTDSPDSSAPANLEMFIQRGGAWYSPAVRCRSSQRNSVPLRETDSTYGYNGLRLVMELQP
jgi:formylglycine-generating enzyme required for sulfatase activity